MLGTFSRSFVKPKTNLLTTLSSSFKQLALFCVAGITNPTCCNCGSWWQSRHYNAVACHFLLHRRMLRLPCPPSQKFLRPLVKPLTQLPTFRLPTGRRRHGTSWLWRGVPLHSLGREVLPTILTQFIRQIDTVDRAVTFAAPMWHLGAMCESWM